MICDNDVVDGTLGGAESETSESVGTIAEFIGLSICDNDMTDNLCEGAGSKIGRLVVVGTIAGVVGLSICESNMADGR